MKVFYPNGKVIDKNLKVSHETLKSGTIIIWHEKTIDSLVDNSL
jgi:hypothetical protein